MISSLLFKAGSSCGSAVKVQRHRLLYIDTVPKDMEQSIMQLTALDHSSIILPCTIHIACIYHYDLHVEKLEAAIQSVITSLPILSGRIRKFHKASLPALHSPLPQYISLCNSGVWLGEASSPQGFSDFLPGSFQRTGFGYAGGAVCLPMYMPDMDVRRLLSGDEAVLKVLLTHLDGGSGSILSIAIPHALADGHTCAQILESLAAAYRGDPPFPKGVPTFHKHLVTPTHLDSRAALPNPGPSSHAHGDESPIVKPAFDKNGDKSPILKPAFDKNGISLPPPHMSLLKDEPATPLPVPSDSLLSGILPESGSSDQTSEITSLETPPESTSGSSLSEITALPDLATNTATTRSARLMAQEGVPEKSPQTADESGMYAGIPTTAPSRDANPETWRFHIFPQTSPCCIDNKYKQPAGNKEPRSVSFQQLLCQQPDVDPGAINGGTKACINPGVEREMTGSFIRGIKGGIKGGIAIKDIRGSSFEGGRNCSKNLDHEPSSVDSSGGSGNVTRRTSKAVACWGGIGQKLLQARSKRQREPSQEQVPKPELDPLELMEFPPPGFWAGAKALATAFRLRAQEALRFPLALMHLTTVTLFIPREDIMRLKVRLQQLSPAGIELSTNDVITAVFWVTTTHLRGRVPPGCIACTACTAGTGHSPCTAGCVDIGVNPPPGSTSSTSPSVSHSPPYTSNSTSSTTSSFHSSQSRNKVGPTSGSHSSHSSQIPNKVGPTSGTDRPAGSSSLPTQSKTPPSPSIGLPRRAIAHKSPPPKPAHRKWSDQGSSPVLAMAINLRCNGLAAHVPPDFFGNCAWCIHAPAERAGSLGITVDGQGSAFTETSESELWRVGGPGGNPDHSREQGSVRLDAKATGDQLSAGDGVQDGRIMVDQDHDSSGPVQPRDAQHKPEDSKKPSMWRRASAVLGLMHRHVQPKTRNMDDTVILCEGAGDEELLHQALAAAVGIRRSLLALRRDAGSGRRLLDHLQQCSPGGFSSKAQLLARVLQRQDGFITNWVFPGAQANFGDGPPSHLHSLIHPTPPWMGSITSALPGQQGFHLAMTVPTTALGKLWDSRVLKLLFPNVMIGQQRMNSES